MSKSSPQDYRGNGEHDWEVVTKAVPTMAPSRSTFRLRVPGGWLYRTAGYGVVAETMVFVPMPEAVKHAV